MKFKNKIFVIALLMIFLSISAVNVAQEYGLLANQTGDELTTGDSLLSEDADEGLSENNEDVLSEIVDMASWKQHF